VLQNNSLRPSKDRFKVGHFPPFSPRLQLSTTFFAFDTHQTHTFKLFVGLHFYMHFLLLMINDNDLGSKFRRNSGSGPFSGIFGSGVAGIIFLGITFFWTF
jgi:hypothetical protein